MDVFCNEPKRRRLNKREMSQTISNNKKRQQFQPLTIYQAALANFEIENKPSNEFTKSEDPLIDEFFEYVATTGRPSVSWDVLRPTVMDDMHINEAEEQMDDIAKENLINNESIVEIKKFIMDKAKGFEGIPFTIQRYFFNKKILLFFRLCELITSPNLHYRTTEKYLRALEKNINIVMTITENGERCTGILKLSYLMYHLGVENFIDDVNNSPIPVERNFIVDEIDEPLNNLNGHSKENDPTINIYNEAEAKNQETEIKFDTQESQVDNEEKSEPEDKTSEL